MRDRFSSAWANRAVPELIVKVRIHKLTSRRKCELENLFHKIYLFLFDRLFGSGRRETGSGRQERAGCFVCLCQNLSGRKALEKDFY
jgi:hypothetical protein